MSSTSDVPDRRRAVAQLIDEMYARGTADTEFPGMHPLFPHSIPRETGDAIRDLVIRERATETMEIGLAMGMSCLFFCDALLAGGASDVRHVAIDPFQAEYFGNAGLITIRSAGLEDLVEFHAEESQIALASLVKDQRSFDLIFVDGDHTFDGAFVDCYFSTRLLRAGGVLLLDDCNLRAIRLIVAFLETTYGYELLTGATGPEEFSWNRGRRGRVRPAGRLAALRKPASPLERDWEDFVEFNWAV